jgi:hypothetical protein
MCSTHNGEGLKAGSVDRRADGCHGRQSPKTSIDIAAAQLCVSRRGKIRPDHAATRQSVKVTISRGSSMVRPFFSALNFLAIS